LKIKLPASMGIIGRGVKSVEAEIGAEIGRNGI
jgi:hypothetical protein